MHVMASIPDDDFCLLTEEKFDFEVFLSPASSKGDEDVEDEVFVGGPTHKEKSISHEVENQVKDSVSSGPSLVEEPSWSPLLEENFDRIHKEANLLASHLESTITSPGADVHTAAPALPEEKFEVDFSAKLDIISKPVDSLTPIKRGTFCVYDSPMKELPSAVQRQLQKVSRVSASDAHHKTSSPLRTTETLPKVATKGRSLLGNRAQLTKPLAKVNSRPPACTRAALPSKTGLPPPIKSCLGLKRSPGTKNTSLAASAEDLLSDSASVASDVSDSSFNTSLPAMRGIPVPNKVEHRGLPVRKATALPNRRVVDRSRNTSSSSSSVSSINSSLTVSPAGKGKNSSLNTSVGSISGRIPTSGSSRLPGSSRKSGILSKPLESSISKRTSFSTHGRKGSEPLPKPVKATPIKKAETPAKRTIDRSISVPSIVTLAAKPGSTVKVNSSSKVFVAPTPTNSLKGVCRLEVTSSPDVPRIIKPKRLMSACSMDSIQKLALPTPQAGLQTPSAAADKPAHSKLRRPSALPTPVSRRLSGIPMFTPKHESRSGRAFLSPEPQSPVCSSERSHASPGQMDCSEEKLAVDQPMPTSTPSKIQPCSLDFNLVDDNGATVCEPAAVKKPSQPSSDNMDSLNPNPEVPPAPEAQESLHDSQLSNKEIQEVLLLDVPAPAIKPEEKVLIDLSNTPDLIKTLPNKVFSGQLIDLSSPLIKWSPEGKKENPGNETPLINLSF